MKKLVNCPDCGSSVSTSATACPQCGAKLKPKTEKSTWIIGGFLMAAFIAVIASGNEPKTCPPLDPVSFRLTQGHEDAHADFMAKAERLRAQGICPIEGDFSKNYQKFYFAVYNAGKSKNSAYFIRLTRDELRK